MEWIIGAMDSNKHVVLTMTANDNREYEECLIRVTAAQKSYPDLEWFAYRKAAKLN